MTVLTTKSLPLVEMAARELMGSYRIRLQQVRQGYHYSRRLTTLRLHISRSGNHQTDRPLVIILFYNS